MLKSSLKDIPIFGWGMQFFEFIFLSRKWSCDKSLIYSNLSRSINDNMPLWLLLFPEGTVLTENTHQNSISYAKKMRIEDDPKHVLIPKSTGLYHSLQWLQPNVTCLYDFTIGYSGLNGINCPFDEYPLDKVFFLGEGPTQIHIHVDRFEISKLPGCDFKCQDDVDPQFSSWLRSRFLEKDNLLKEFYQNGKFPDMSRNECGGTKRLVISPKVQDWVSLTSLLLGSLASSIYILFLS